MSLPFADVQELNPRITRRMTGPGVRAFMRRIGAPLLDNVPL